MEGENDKQHIHVKVSANYGNEKQLGSDVYNGNLKISNKDTSNLL